MIYTLTGEPAVTGMGIAGAAGDGVTDDTEALTSALNQSNTVIDGGNKKYKYELLEIENVENLTVKNVIFWQGEAVNVKGCRNVRFEHCRWEGIRAANAASTTQTCGIRLMERNENGNEIWCENVWIEGCVFDDIDFNHNINVKSWGPCGNEISGQAILPRSVHKLFIKHNVFTQTKGNAAIHWNSYKKNGYAEITDNLFYLTGFGGICVYAVQQQFPKVKGKICNNQFIGCGLGYQDPNFLNARTEQDRGVGCAALLGGAGTNAAPYKWHLTVENNVFEDCCESSIEGPVWNPVIGNYINGQGTLQDEENCRLMEQKYHLPYKLQVRYNPSVNFIYLDPTFERNYAECTRLGIPVGVYGYFKATDKAQAKVELALLKAALAGKTLSLPVAVDVEDKQALAPLGKSTLTDLTAYELGVVESWGVYAMLYTGLYFAQTNLYMGGAALKPYDVWLAAYRTNKPAPGWPFGMWQYTRSGSVPGVTGGVDLSHAYKDYTAIIRRAGLTKVKGA